MVDYINFFLFLIRAAIQIKNCRFRFSRNWKSGNIFSLHYDFSSDDIKALKSYKGGT